MPEAGLLDPASIRRLAEQVGLRPSKRLGQNFVHDPNTVRRIVSASGVGPDDVVLEIGPGLGSLTLGLLERAGSVTAVEVDSSLALALPGTIWARMPEAAPRLRVVVGDALAIDRLPGPPPTALVANLPYNVAVPVILRLADRFASWTHALVMVQLEVARRLAASPGGREYGAPSVKLAWHAAVEFAGTVGPAVFWPRPRVDSGLVRMIRRPPPPAQVSREQVFAVIDAAFGQRRKMLRSALAQIAGGPDAAAEAVAAAGVPPTARGERLGLGEFVAIAERLGETVGRAGSRRLPG